MYLYSAVKEVSGLLHVASIINLSPKVEEVVPPMVKAARNVLAAASKSPRVKSVVYTSSNSAARLAKANEKFTVTNRDVE